MAVGSGDRAWLCDGGSGCDPSPAWRDALAIDLAACCRRHGPGWRCWPDQELDHPGKRVCPITGLPCSAPDRSQPRPSRQGANAMAMLADQVDLVIGVDTHKHTHTAAVVAAASGGVLAQQTVPADSAGYQALISLVQQHPGRRVWALEGSGAYCVGLARRLAQQDEWVVEVDCPKRPARRHGAKSYVLDAARAAREALARL